MTHTEWLYCLKINYDRFDLGYTDAIWAWISNENEYKNLISKMSFTFLYSLAVRN